MELLENIALIADGMKAHRQSKWQWGGGMRSLSALTASHDTVRRRIISLAAGIQSGPPHLPLTRGGMSETTNAERG